MPPLTLPTPPSGTPYLDPKTGIVTEAWRRYLLALETALVINAAPIDAQYWVSTSNTTLTTERNLASLASGYVKITVGAGIATPSSTAQVPAGTDLSGQVPLANGGTGANLSATGGTSQVLQQASAGATVTVGQLASADLSDLANGTYTPTLTNVANLDGSTAFDAQYLRLGSVVTVSGKVSVDPTAGAATQLGISLPIPSDFTAAEQCGGVAFATGIAGQGAGIVADVTNNRAEMQWVAVDTSDQVMAFTFSYVIA